MLHADRWYRLQYGNMIENWFVPLSLGACALLAVAILWKVPQWQVGRVKDLAPKERFDRVNEARKTLATILGGIVLLVGGFFTYQNLNLAREGQITDRFSKAIEQLGAVDTSGKKKLEVRLGGIYALERIANESERDHWPIMEVLCTYVRENAPRKPQESARENQASAPATRPPADIQAILTVLGRRNTKYDSKEQIFVLSQTDLRYVRFFELNLRWAFFYYADLHGASFYETDLHRANFEKADLSEADFRDADLSDADLSDADLSEADLRGADLRDADLRDARDLTQEQIDAAKGDSRTKLPKNLHMPESWK
jgi:hypothetical protein